MHHTSLVICSKVEGDTFSFAKVVNVCHIETQLDGNVMRNVHLWSITKIIIIISSF